MRRIFITLFLLVAALPALGQRQTPGRSSLDFSATFGALTGKPFTVTGGTLSRNSYGYLGYTVVGVDAALVPYGYKVHINEKIDPASGSILSKPRDIDDRFDALDVAAGGGYGLRLLAPRSRVVILSASLAGYVGVRYCQQMSGYVKKASVNNKDITDKDYCKKLHLLIYAVPELKFEVFPAKNVSLYLSCRPKVRILDLLGGSDDWFRVNAGFGVKVYL